MPLVKTEEDLKRAELKEPLNVEKDIKPGDGCFDERKVDIKGIYNFSNEVDECSFERPCYNHDDKVKDEDQMFDKIINNAYDQIDKKQLDTHVAKKETIESYNNETLPNISSDKVKDDNLSRKGAVDIVTVNDCTRFSNHKNSKILNSEKISISYLKGNDGEQPIEVFDFTSSRGYFQSIKEENEEVPETNYVEEECSYFEEEKYSSSNMFISSESTHHLKNECSDNKTCVNNNNGLNDDQESDDESIEETQKEKDDVSSDDPDDPDYILENEDDNDEGGGQNGESESTGILFKLLVYLLPAFVFK